MKREMNHKKGISLAIETIIFMILAVLVLSVLLGFLFGPGWQAQNTIEQQRLKTSICIAYTTKSPLCNSDGSGVKDIDILADVCGPQKLNVAGCAGSRSASCFAECCKGFCKTA